MRTLRGAERKTMPDYRKLRFNNLNSPQFRHIWLLLFWPVFGLLFTLLERGGISSGFHVMYCAMDDAIPFLEGFMIPYMFWHLYLFGMLAYTFFMDVPAFKRMMYFIIITYTVTVAVYFIYPTCQHLRPESFPRDNFLTRYIAHFYAFDTDTNVCPSIHVLGAVAVSFAAWNSRLFKKPIWRAAFSAMTALISLSTVFVKQHSILDVLWALPVCAGAWIAVTAAEKRKQKIKAPSL